MTIAVMMKRLTITHPLDRRVAIGSIEHVLARLRSATAAERQPGKPARGSPANDASCVEHSITNWRARDKQTNRAYSSLPLSQNCRNSARRRLRKTTHAGGSAAPQPVRIALDCRL